MSEDTVATIEFSILDVNDENSVIAYERALYRAYTHAAKDMPQEEFTFDRSARRARHNLSYTSQAIFQATKQGAVVAGIAVNKDMSNPVRVKAADGLLGESSKKAYEIMFMFSLLDNASGLTTLSKLGMFAKNTVKDENVEVVYAMPCSSRARHPYVVAGFNSNEGTTEEGNRAMFLDLRKNNVKNKRTEVAEE